MTDTKVPGHLGPSLDALSGSYDQALTTRPPTVPAYYHGRPAGVWLTIFRRNGLHSRNKA
jgi:hypothetical protein